MASLMPFSTAGMNSFGTDPPTMPLTNKLPPPQGKGNLFVNGIVGGSVPKEFIPAVEKGIKEAIETGVMAGYPVVDTKVTLFDGSYHDVDSDEISFRIAPIFRFKDV